MSEPKLREDLLLAFAMVEGTRYVPTEPDDWRCENPASFNCSSFVYWIAARCLGRSIAELESLNPPSAGAIGHGENGRYREIIEGDIETGDIFCYAPRGGSLPAHCMVYIGNDEVIGACDLEGRVLRRPADYEAGWELVIVRRMRVDPPCQPSMGRAGDRGRLKVQ
jgi:cell wall-associated NlpC family hydrolase